MWKFRMISSTEQYNIGSYGENISFSVPTKPFDRAWLNYKVYGIFCGSGIQKDGCLSRT